MCNLRSYRHTCGHYSTKHISQCRGTYSSPTTNAPLCHSSPSLTVSFPGPCRSCEYTTFCTEWEDRIAEVEARHNAARQILDELEDDWACAESSLGDSTWGSSDISGSGYEAGVGAGGYGGDATDDIFGFGDSETAQRERTRAESEIEHLRSQYYKEQWNGWRSMLSGPPDAVVARRSNRHRRTSAPRLCGESPLKIVHLAEDQEYEEDESDLDNGRLRRADSDTPSDGTMESNSDETDEEGRNGASGLTRFSWEPVVQRRGPPKTFAPTFGDDEDDEEDDFDAFGSKAGWGTPAILACRPRRPMSSLLAAIEDDELLPDYGMA